MEQFSRKKTTLIRLNKKLYKDVTLKKKSRVFLMIKSFLIIKPFFISLPKLPLSDENYHLLRTSSFLDYC